MNIGRISLWIERLWTNIIVISRFACRCAKQLQMKDVACGFALRENNCPPRLPTSIVGEKLWNILNNILNSSVVYFIYNCKLRITSVYRPLSVPSSRLRVRLPGLRCPMALLVLIFWCSPFFMNAN